MPESLLFALIPGFLWLFLTFTAAFLCRENRPGTAVFFCWLLLGMYLIYIPVADVVSGIKEFYGFRLSFLPAISQTICLVYSAAIAGFAAGVWAGWLIFRNRTFSLPLLRVKQGPEAVAFLYGFQVLVWLLYFFNLHLSGIAAAEVFNPLSRNQHAILFAASYRYPILELLSASVPVCLFLLLLLGQRRKPEWWLFFLFWLALSLLGGWRFRIILFVLFVLFHQVQRTGFVKWFLPVAMLLLPGMAWLTLNRMAIAKRQFELITFNLRQFDFQVFHQEFSNSRTFRACLSFGQNLSFPGIKGWLKVPPEGKPWILQVSKAWIPQGWPWNPNPALSQPEEFYLLFGLGGMILLMAGLGMYCIFLDRLKKEFWHHALHILLTALLFQWLSRGYFPFQLKITLICLLPFLLLQIAGPYLSFRKDGNKA